jgi:phosphoribosylaminoimidazole-succinocarboxamide synthase
VLVDEVLTPDSSRFWPADKYEVGKGQSSYDKVCTANKPCLPHFELRLTAFSNTFVTG